VVGASNALHATPGGGHCRRSELPRSERSWDLFAGERYRRGETDIPAYEAYNPFRHRQQGPYA
jgi:hypothetical protein